MKGTPAVRGYRRHSVRTGIGFAAAALTLAVTGGQADANDFAVTTTAADGSGSLTAAVKQSRKNSGGDEISFGKRLKGEIELPPQVTLKGKVTITGSGYGDPASTNFKRLVLRGHRGGTKILVDHGNAAVRGLYIDGASIEASRSDLTIRDSFLEGKRTVDATGVSAGQSLRILKTTVEGFDRGIATNGTGRIDQSTIADNVGSGGIFVGGGSADVSNSTISGNVVNTSGPFAVPAGGGLNVGQYGASARVTNSTIVGNQAISNSTSSGGGLFGNVDVLNSPISGNRAVTGAGVAGNGVGDADLSNSIVYGNVTFDGSPSDCGNPFTSDGGNVVGTPGECLLDSRDRNGVDPLLGPLTDNGGPTLTMALGDGSPAIGLAVKSTAAKFDQRGILRDADPDAGSVESKG